MIFVRIGLVALLASIAPLWQSATEAQSVQSLVDDFEGYNEGSIPVNWKILRNSKLIDVLPEHMNENESLTVASEYNNNFLRVYSHGEVATLTMPMDEGSAHEWDLTVRPTLSWDWRANRLPDGAREDKDKLNDSGGAIYVFFSIGGFLIKRPTAIKYTYSSTLPVGTVVEYGRLRVVVVSSGADGLGEWKHIERNVADDYRRFFGGDPPRYPLSIRLWSDTDNMDGYAEVDLDNILQK